MHSPTTTEFFLRLWAEVDVRRQHSPQGWQRPDFVGIVACVVYLRWLDAQSLDRDSSSRLGLPRMAPALRWEQIASLAREDLTVFLGAQVPSLLSLEQGNHHELHAAIGKCLQKKGDHFDPEVLKFVVDWIDTLDLTRPVGLAAARELLDDASRWATGDNRYFGIHTTPPAVSDLMVELVDPRAGERIYDPCFGVGGLLVRCSRHIAKQRTVQLKPGASDAYEGVLAGYEINNLSFLIASIRTLLEGHGIALLLHGDALALPSDGLFKQQGFDVILACPPWGSAPQRASQEHFVVPSTDYANLFLQHTANNLRNGGRAVVAIPEGTLFRAGPTQSVRRWLIDNFQVEGVVSLPPGTFAPATTIKANLLVLRKTKPTKSVRFCVVHALEGVRQRSLLGSESAAEIAWRFRNDDDSADAWSVPVESIVTRNCELVAKRTGADALAACLAKVQAISDDARIVALGSVARVFQGGHYDRDRITETQGTVPPLVGIVRIGDLRNGLVQSPTQFLVADDEQHALLEEGDVIVSVSGTIGKTAIVRSPSGPLIASHGIAVIRLNKEFAPEFIAALLDSAAYQDWLKGHANGSTIQHLTVRSLRQLPVVVLSDDLQERIVTADRGHKTDALSSLLGIATGTETDPIGEWLMASEAVREWSTYKPDGVTARVAELIDALALSLQPVRNETVHSRIASADARLVTWAARLYEIVQGMRGLSRIPEGAGLLSVLDNGRVNLADTLSTLEGNAYSACRLAIALTRKICDALASIRQRLLDRVEIAATVTPAAVFTGAPADVVVGLRNSAPLALRGIVFRTSPDSLGNDVCSYLDSRSEHRLSISLPAQAEAGDIDFEILWRGLRLDGQQTDGRIALRVAVLPAGSDGDNALAGDLGSSPYIVGNPIDRKEMLFGREEQLDRIVRQLTTSNKANVILLEGNRRTGKTSILKRLTDPTTLPGWVAINISFQGGEGVQGSGGLPTAEVYRLMAKQIGWQAYELGVETWLPGIGRPDPSRKFKPQFAAAVRAAFTDINPFETFELYLQEVFAVLSERRLLLMLDEFDKLQEGIEAGVTSPQVPENIRYLIHTYPQMSAVLSGGRQLKGLRAAYWSALFGFGHRVDVSALPLEAARLLVTEPVRNRLVYVDEARDHLIALCARHPFLLQSLCNHVFEASARDSVRTITVPFVEEAASALISDNEHFHTLWGYARTERRRYILAIIERHPLDAEPISFDLIAAALEEAGINLPRRERLGDDMDWLCDLELVSREAGESFSYYRLAVPLFGKWIRACIDFDDLKRRAVDESQEYL
jgi:type I restriction enzyme M protein